MYVPEYSITPKILQNISDIEYAKAIIDYTVILPIWRRNLEKEVQINNIYSLLVTSGSKISVDDVKKYIDGRDTKHAEITTMHNLVNEITNLGKNKQLDETSFKKAFFLHTKTSSYRTENLDGGVNPEEVFAELVKLFDWLNSIDARETHPIIVSAIFMSQIQAIRPLKTDSELLSNLAALLYLYISSYDMQNLIQIGNFYHTISEYSGFDDDLTKWLEYYTSKYASELRQLKNEVLSLAKESKTEKVAGHKKLSDREQKIVIYIQDYGQLQNKDFPILFPNVSEDTVLRTLKNLVDKNIIVKIGSTKSSRYELSNYPND